MKRAHHADCASARVGATLRRDYPVLQFGVLVVASAVVIVNILIDCTYAALDPRVRLSGGAA
jgi:peptide/nickel transport system permease protein